MSDSYRLVRSDGVLVFNAFSDRERFWVSMQAAAQASGAMYAEIDRDTFDAVWSGDASPLAVTEGQFARSWDREREAETARAHRLRDAIDAHGLRAEMSDPVRSAVPRS